jgi:hypothetical protein
MRKKIKKEDKKVKLSITLNPKFNNLMEEEMINKSKLIEMLLTNYYGQKKM